MCHVAFLTLDAAYYGLLADDFFQNFDHFVHGGRHATADIEDITRDLAMSGADSGINYVGDICKPSGLFTIAEHSYLLT